MKLHTTEVSKFTTALCDLGPKLALLRQKNKAEGTPADLRAMMSGLKSATPVNFSALTLRVKKLFQFCSKFIHDCISM